MRAMLEEGMRLPEATLLEKGPEGTHEVRLSERLKGRKVVIFAVPGAFTPTCDSAHMPSFVRTADEFRGRGVDEIICIAVNDVHVLRYWGEVSGAIKAGITLLADPAAEFTRAVGMDYSNEPVGMLNRSRRYAMVVEDGLVTALHLEQPGVCEVSTGEAMLAEV
jgi:peroxiredoxin